MKIKELPETERPYEKLEIHGEKALSNAELLAIIIKTGTKEETSVQIAQKILSISNQNKKEDIGLNILRQTTIEQLKQIKGIGRVKAIQLKAVGELSIRMSQPSDYRKIKVKTPDDLANILINEMRFEEKEIIKIVILNSRNEILKIKDIALGGANFVNIAIKDILAEPIKMQAPKMILVHNHPSGDAKPSEGDIKITEKIYQAAELFEIELMDHLVIGNMQYISIFSEMIKEQKQNKTIKS